MNGKFPFKPDCLISYEIVKESKIPLIDGGILDQPYIWSIQYEVIDQEVKLQDAIKKRNEEMKPK